AWFSYGDERLGQGRENVRVFLKENDDLRLKIEDQVLVHYGVRKAEDEVAPPANTKADTKAEVKVDAKADTKADAPGKADKARVAEAGNGSTATAKK
ncbi:DNA recombination/repair protein RecA, partial [bacterium]